MNLQILVVFITCLYLNLPAQEITTQKFMDTATGDKENFIYVNNEIKLNAAKAGEMCLSNAIQVDDSMIWEMAVRLNFSPSSSNQVRIYLLANHQNLKIATEALYLKVGETGNLDGLNLYRWSNKKETLIKKIGPGVLSKSSNSFFLSVAKKFDDWKISLRNELDGTKYNFDSSFVVNASFGNFGLSCKFSLSNAKGFSFKNFKIGKLILDKSPPIMVSEKRVDSILSYDFNENILSENIEVKFTPQIHKYQTVVEGNTFKIIIQEKLQDEVQYNLSFAVQDPSLNIQVINSSFWNYLLKASDVVISEIMYHPENSLGVLENQEYIELYNHTSHPIDLALLSLNVNNKEIKLPKYNLLGKEYVLLSKDSVRNNTNYVNNVPIGDWFTLLYGASHVKIFSKEKLIHEVDYQLDNIDDDFKKEGGWSLENGNVHFPCLGFKAWAFSTSNIGGTPGYENKFSFVTSRIKELKIEKLVYVNDSSLKLTMNTALTQQTGSFISCDLKIDTLLISNGFGTEVVLVFKSKMEQGKLYHLFLKNGWVNCLKLQVDSSKSIPFAIPYEPKSGTVVLNEILFNPTENGVKFIEIYNKSSSAIDLQKLKFASIDSENKINYSYVLSADREMFLPGEFLCFSTDTNKLRVQYSKVKNLRQLAGWPTMNTTSGHIALIQLNGEILDEVAYDEGWHFQNLTDVKGVSLERISFEAPSKDSESWLSATFVENYGTPGYENSQKVSKNELFPGFNFVKNVFSPNNDGLDDHLSINYNLAQAGYSCSLSIYNSSGAFLGDVKANAILGKEGTILWDGILEGNSLIVAGVYVLSISAQHQETNHVNTKILFTVNR